MYKDIVLIMMGLGAVGGLLFAYILQEIKWKLRRKANRLWDDSEYDATDFAHPAFWRGEQWSCHMFCKIMNEVLDGAIPSGLMHEPLQSLRQKIHRAVNTRDSYKTTIEKCFVTLNKYKPDITGGLNLVDQIQKLCEKLNAHTKVQGGVCSDCGHPVQCLYACARVDGGPVRCSMCDMKEEIKRLEAYTEYVTNIKGTVPKDYRDWWISIYNKENKNG